MDEFMELTGLMPHPADEWERMLPLRVVESRRQVRDGDDRRGAPGAPHPNWSRTPTIICRACRTAAVLGWEQGFDVAHLQERRRFFTVWVARAPSGWDFGADFACTCSARANCMRHMVRAPISRA